MRGFRFEVVFTSLLSHFCFITNAHETFQSYFPLGFLLEMNSISKPLKNSHTTTHFTVVHLRMYLLWYTAIDRLIGASFNRRTRMKAESSRQNPHKQAMKL